MPNDHNTVPQPVVMIDKDGSEKRYKSYAEASRETGIHRSSIGMAARGERDHAEGRVFYLQDEYDEVGE